MDTVEKHLNSLDHQEQQPRMRGCLSEPLNWMLSALTPAGSLGRQASRLLAQAGAAPGDRGHKSWRVLMEPSLCDDMLLTMPFCCMKCDGSPRPRKARSQPGFHPLGRSREERPVLPSSSRPPVPPAVGRSGAAQGERRGSVEVGVSGPQSSGGGVSRT